MRILTAVVLGVLLLATLFLLPPFWTRVAFGATFVGGAWEWAGFGGLRGFAARTAYAIVIALLLALAWRASADPERLGWMLRLACLWWIVALLWLSLAPARHFAPLTLACGVPVLVPAFVALARIHAGGGALGGPRGVLWLLLLVFAADIGAFFAGRRFGRLKLAPRVSPGKTWEGAIGGLACVTLVALGGAAALGQPAATALGFGCAVGVVSIVGDLTESMFKRAADLKDSGTLLPGHGGILDRIDSITAAAPLFALGLLGAGVIA
ncbi:MAG: phosphatidate cytidylyltransferase [Gammaproteobacteria bacterium]|nr:phosphatidate cytidylyltransferase [Gammaproteobacteria bacterium]